MSEILPSLIMQKPTNVETISKKNASAVSGNFSGHFLSLTTQIAMEIAIMMAKMKSARPGGPSLNGHVRPGCDVVLALSSAAKAVGMIHDSASRYPKRF